MARDNRQVVKQVSAQSEPLSTKRPRSTRSWWLKQLHTWHWISAALSLVSMMAFTVTGITLNHSASIPGHPVVMDRSGRLSPSLLRLLKAAPAKPGAPMPDAVAAAARDTVGLDPAGRSADWSDGEVYVAMPRPGGDAWVSIDRASGVVKAETTSQGWISWLNDLHKGRNTGLGWRLFIDAFAAAALVFTITGLVLLQLHSRNRRLTWPLVGSGLVIPVVVAVLFIH